MVTTLESAGVPWSVGMEVTGMRGAATYRRYAVTPRQAVNLALGKVSSLLQERATMPRVVPIRK